MFFHDLISLITLTAVKSTAWFYFKFHFGFRCTLTQMCDLQLYATILYTSMMRRVENRGLNDDEVAEKKLQQAECKKKRKWKRNVFERTRRQTPESRRVLIWHFSNAFFLRWKVWKMFFEKKIHFVKTIPS